MAAADRKIILDQIRRMADVPAARAPEAPIFYSARALEGACHSLVGRLVNKPSSNVFSNLMTIDAHRLIDNLSKELSHTLRRMGNSVRHSLDDSTQEDVQLAIVLTREVIRWLDALDRVDDDADALAILDRRIDPDWPVARAVALLGRVEHGDAGAVADLLERRDTMLSSRFLATLGAEILIGCGRAADAGLLLASCARTFGSDQRHLQLSALVLSRTNKLEEAVKAADKLLKNDKTRDDDETAGIAGGIYKRRWDRDPTQAEALAKAHALYFNQWDAGRRINAYLGVNAAATAVYRGETEKARAIAAEVVAAMERRDATLARAGLKPRDGGVADYYDRVSRAEALLVAGDHVAAEIAYRDAFAAYDWLGGHIEGTRAQARRIAATLRLDGFAP